MVLLGTNQLKLHPNSKNDRERSFARIWHFFSFHFISFRENVRSLPAFPPTSDAMKQLTRCTCHKRSPSTCYSSHNNINKCANTTMSMMKIVCSFTISRLYAEYLSLLFISLSCVGDHVYYVILLCTLLTRVLPIPSIK